MQTVRARNIHQAVPLVMFDLETLGALEEDKQRSLEPVTIVYEKPTERVTLWPQLDVDPIDQVLRALKMFSPGGQPPQEVAQGHVMFSDNHGRLDMLVISRTGDRFWEDAVRFSFLHEYQAELAGKPIGLYRHVYNELQWPCPDNDTRVILERLSEQVPANVFKETCPYETNQVTPSGLCLSGNVGNFDRDIEMVDAEGGCIGLKNWFVRKVVVPMHQAKVLMVDQEFSAAQSMAETIQAGVDWGLAVREYFKKLKF